MKEPTKEELVELFRKYVEGMGDTPRHTEEAIETACLYQAVAEKHSGFNHERLKELTETAMEMAVEFELSGFMAGYRAALRSRE